ncbi:MAG: hypothetical protein CL693_01215 [Cellvibrionaceae bacterium]|nr:hypothetical protein [Cellvibrionaceae bacterium]|tara:strand:- start:44 stop:298 length:255 start_codon:yes stop_codon:yes gene_type:complete
MFIELNVRTASIVHGYDADHQEIIERVNEPHFVRKLIALDRLLSVSEQYLLVSSSHGRVMFWEYQETMDEVKARLKSPSDGLLV